MYEYFFSELREEALNEIEKPDIKPLFEAYMKVCTSIFKYPLTDLLEENVYLHIIAQTIVLFLYKASNNALKNAT